MLLSYSQLATANSGLNILRTDRENIKVKAIMTEGNKIPSVVTVLSKTLPPLTRHNHAKI